MGGKAEGQKDGRERKSNAACILPLSPPKGGYLFLQNLSRLYFFTLAFDMATACDEGRNGNKTNTATLLPTTIGIAALRGTIPIDREAEKQKAERE